MLTGVAVGTIITILPSGCDTVYINGTTYKECDNQYYEPFYADDKVSI